MSELVDTKTVAEHLGVTVETVRAWVRQNRIPCIRPSRRTIRFRLCEVERAITKPQSDRNFSSMSDHPAVGGS